MKKLPPLLYLVIVSVFMFIGAREGYLGLGSMLTLLLTLPWSLIMAFFMWGLVHGGISSLSIFLIPFALLNGYLIYRLTNRRKTVA